MKKLMIVLGISSLVLSACTTNNAPNQKMQRSDGHGQVIRQQQSETANILADRVIVRATGEMNTALVPYRAIDGQVWLPLDKAVDIYDYHYVFDPESLKADIGYTDPLFELTVGKREAKVQEKTVTLTDAPQMVDGEPSISIRSLSELWQTSITWDEPNRLVTIVTPDDTLTAKSIEAQSVTTATAKGVGSFRTQPSTGSRVMRSLNPGEQVTVLGSPNRFWYHIKDNNNVQGYVSSSFLSLNSGTGVTPLPSQPNTAAAAGNNSKLISFAKQLMGTPYKFASGPYPSTRTFDCSSFTQYVFREAGLKLPRSSRSQAQTGTTISRSQLKPGDLLFFSVPGRFANNRTVGHVGIYIGNNQIIHTFGRPGVTITNFTGTWDKRYLSSKRIS
jgi:cell wall-associated NlpC family hydrolase